MFTSVKTNTEVEAMRISGRMLATVLAEVEKSTQEGVSTG